LQWCACKNTQWIVFFGRETGEYVAKFVVV
jgi:hypothetical protein